MYTGRTIEEAVRKWQADALPHIGHLAVGLGIGIQMDNSDWYENSSQLGLWHKRRERDMIEFKPMRTAKIRRTMGEARPVGEQKNELAVVDDAGPNDFDTTESLSWTRGMSEELVDTSSETYGWGVTVTAGFEIGGDAAGGKVIGGLALESNGSYGNERAKSKGDSWETTHTTEVDLLVGEIARIIQTQRTGEVEVDVEDFIVLELGWRVRDWKNRSNRNLDGHAGYGGKERSKSRWHWDCLDAFDLLTMGEGANPRYPSMRSNWSGWPSMQWLMKEDNRTIKVKSKARFKRGIFGNSRVQKLGEGGILLEETDAD